MEYRTGFGFDVHRLVADRQLVLGGVHVPSDRGLAGHSDADVLTHAVMDALLGALAAGDLGSWFPDSNPEYGGANSLDLLRRILASQSFAGWRVVNVDSTVVAEAPKLAPFIPAMRNGLASVLGTPLHRISVKATTTEGLGYTGRGEGIAAYATVLVGQGPGS